MNDPPDDFHQLAERLLEALSSRDIEMLRSCFAPQAKIWHNVRDSVLTVDQVVDTMRGVNAQAIRYTHVRRSLTLDGWAQQHVVEVVSKSGMLNIMPACHIVSVSNGKIARIDEYADSTRQHALRQT